jgi:hypothetical protein
MNIPLDEDGSIPSISFSPTTASPSKTRTRRFGTDPKLEETHPKENWIEYNSLDHHPTIFNMKFSSTRVQFQFTETSIEYRVIE